MPTAPYLVGSAGATSTSSLTVPITTTTNNGDNLKLGVVVNTAGAIPSVSDTQGNTWNLILSDTTNTNPQLYVFEAPGAAQLVAGTDTVTITTAAA